jgi:hypothetical protein
MVTLHVVPLLEVQPVQLARVEPLAAVAVSVTLLPELKLALQTEPQLIPTGLLVTVPVPVPDLLTLREN